MTVKKFFDLLNTIYPIDSQDEWDNSGIYEFGSDQELSNPILTLDINIDVVNFAINNNSNLIISHHPIYINEQDLKLKHIKNIFKKLKENNISIISLHTCFDKHKNGTSYQIIKRLKGFKITRSKKSPYLFFGTSLSKITFNSLINKIKNNLDIEYIKLISSKAELISNEKKKNIRIAVVGGSGASEIDLITKKDKIDFFITSEIKWHMWTKNNIDYFSILEVPHSIEKVFIKAIKEKITNINFLEFYPNKIEVL